MARLDKYIYVHGVTAVYCVCVMHKGSLKQTGVWLEL